MATLPNKTAVYLKSVEQSNADLKAKLDLAVEALLPLAKIAKAWRSDGLDESRPGDWGDTVPKASEVQIYGGRGGKTLLKLSDAFRAESFFERLGVKL